MRITELLGRLICPPKCICCKEVFSIYDNSAFCSSCYENLCCRIFDVNCKKETDYFDACYSYYKYHNWYVKKIIAHTKYVFSKEYKNFIGECARRSLKKHNLIDKIDVITFSPRRRVEISKYGFDQAEELAKSITEKTSIPTASLLKRTGSSKPQKKLNKEDRKANIKGRFSCTTNLNGKRILLVDDVITTGATVNECAKMLKKQGAKAVYVWTIAQ